MRITALITLMLLLACGKESHLVLDSTKIYKNNAKDSDKAYATLAEGLYDKKIDKLVVIPEAWFVMGELHLEKEEFAKAKTAFDKVQEIESTREKKEYTDKAKQKLAQTFKKFYDISTEKFNASIEASDNEKMAFLKESKKNMETAMMLDPRVETYIMMGKIKAQLNDDTAIESYKKALEMDPKNKDIVYDMGIFYFNKQNYSNSAMEFEKVLSMDPNNESALKLRAFSYQNGQKYDKAAEAYEAYLAINNSDTEAKEYLVQIYYLNKNYDKCIKLANEIISNENGTETVYNFYINSFYMKINDAITSKNKEQQKSLLATVVGTLEAAVQKDEFMNELYIWQALEELYGRQGNTKSQKMAEKKVKELSN